jgi:citrate lyase beta subunit
VVPTGPGGRCALGYSRGVSTQRGGRRRRRRRCGRESTAQGARVSGTGDLGDGGDAKGVFNIRQIACAHDRMDVILMGTLDLSAELRARHTANRTPFLFALSSCVMAAREAGIHIIDGVHLDVEDKAGLKNACHQVRDLGFDGKSLIHPKQIDIANEVFAPSAFELEYADRQVEAWQQATS